MDEFEAIRMFVRVVDSGSFSAVAREAGIGQPAVGKQIAALEVRLGAQLLRRTSRKVSGLESGSRRPFPDTTNVLSIFSFGSLPLHFDRASQSGLLPGPCDARREARGS